MGRWSIETSMGSINSRIVPCFSVLTVEIYLISKIFGGNSVLDNLEGVLRQDGMPAGTIHTTCGGRLAPDLERGSS